MYSCSPWLSEVLRRQQMRHHRLYPPIEWTIFLDLSTNSLHD